MWQNYWWNGVGIMKNQWRCLGKKPSEIVKSNQRCMNKSFLNVNLVIMKSFACAWLWNRVFAQIKYIYIKIVISSAPPQHNTYIYLTNFIHFAYTQMVCREKQITIQQSKESMLLAYEKSQHFSSQHVYVEYTSINTFSRTDTQMGARPRYRFVDDFQNRKHIQLISKFGWFRHVNRRDPHAPFTIAYRLIFRIFFKRTFFSSAATYQRRSVVFVVVGNFFIFFRFFCTRACVCVWQRTLS